MYTDIWFFHRHALFLCARNSVVRLACIWWRRHRLPHAHARNCAIARSVFFLRTIKENIQVMSIAAFCCCHCRWVIFISELALTAFVKRDEISRHPICHVPTWNAMQKRKRLTCEHNLNTSTSSYTHSHTHTVCLTLFPSYLCITIFACNHSSCTSSTFVSLSL